MKLRIVTLDKNDRIWDIRELNAGFTKAGNFDTRTQRELQFAIKNMNSKFIYTVDKIEIYRIED